MALVIADRVKETTTTTGTSTYTLAGAVDGFQSFAAVGNGNTTYYACTDGTDYEVGIGTYTASGTTLARTTIIESSNSDAAVNWGSGEKDIFVTVPAEKYIVRDASGNVSLTGNFAVSGTVDGRDIATDGTKLDGIESGATADQTAAEIRTLVGSASDSNVFTDADHSKLDGIESGATADQTITAGSGLSGGGTGNVTLSHSDTSSQSSVNNSGRTYIQDITLDGFGHVTGISSATETVTNTDTNTTSLPIENSSGTTQFTATDTTGLQFVGSGATSVAFDSSNKRVTISSTDTNTDTNTTYSAGSGLSLSGTTFSHSDTSSQASSNNSGRTYIQDITLDTYGHVTGIATATETVVNTDTNTTYTAGSGLSLSGTTFSHTDTSSQASVNNSGGTVVQDVTLDTYGHVTGLTSYNLDGRYYTETEADTRFLRGNTSDTMSGNLTVDNGTSSSILVQSDDGGTSGIYLRGNSQGTGFVEVGQSSTYGGGMYYNGDGSPAFASGETADTIGFYRLSNGTRTEVFSYPHGSNTVTFNGSIAVGGTVDGRDVASDGTKLDGIESGATADQTASEILTAIKTVDGSGSGLDADLWDGNQFGSYINQPLTSGSNPTFQSLYLANSLIHAGDTDTYITFGTDMMFFTCGNTDRIVANSNGVSVTGALTATGNITAYYSDERLKTKIGDIEGALEKIKQLTGFYYIENKLAKDFGFNNNQRQVALSAQDVQAVMPEAVSLAPFDFAKDDETGENLPNASKSGENYLTVDYARLVPLLIEAIKEQQTQIDDLQAKLGM